MSEKLHNTLEVMFDNEQPVEVRFEGGDKTLLEGVDSGFGSARDSTNPAYTTRYRGGFDDWATEYIYTNPDSRGFVVTLRRNLLLETGRVYSNPELKGDFEQALGFARTHHELMRRAYDHKLSTDNCAVYTPVIEMYIRDEAQKGEDGEYINDGSAVWQLPKLLELSGSACRDFETRNAPKVPLISKFVTSVQEEISALGEDFDVQQYLRSSGRPKDHSRALEVLETDVNMANRMISVQEKANALNLSPARLSKDTDSELTFPDLCHVKFHRSSQEPNTISVGDTPVALTGRNGSGKTHLLEALGLATISATSIGHAPAEAASVPEMAGMATLFRPRGGGNELSAFGAEAKQWSEVLTWLEGMETDKAKLILTDEPFSSTDHHEQAIILDKLVHRLKQLGARVVMTGHSDMTELAKEGIVQPYHFTREGDRQHLLKEGIGDSDAFAEAREQGLNEDIVARAEALVSGSEFRIPEVTTRELPRQLSVAERYGEMNPGMGWFMSRAPIAEPRSYSSSLRGSWSSADYRFNDLGGAMSDLQKAVHPNRTNFDLSKSDILGWSYRVEARMLKDGSTACEKDLLDRQEFFCNVMEYEGVEQLQTELVDFWILFHGLSSDRTQNNHCDEYGVGSFLANPFADHVMTLVSTLKGSCGRNWYEDSYSIRHDGLPYKERVDYISSIARSIIEVLGDHMDEELKSVAANFVWAVEFVAELREQADDEGQVVVEKVDRKRLYDMADQLVSLYEKKHPDTEVDKDGLSWIRDHTMYNLNGAFFSYKENTRFQRIWTKPKKSVRLSEIENLVLGGEYMALPTLFADLLTESLPVISLNKLKKKHHDSIESAYRACRVAEKAGVRTPAINALAVLSYLTSSEDNIGSIRDHLKSIGGTVAESLAEYFDDNIRAYFEGQSDGLALKDRIAPRIKGIPLEKPKKDEEESTYRQRSRRTHQVSEKAKLTASTTNIFSRHFERRENPITPYSEAVTLFELIRFATNRLKKEEFSPVIYGKHPISMRSMDGPGSRESITSDVSYRSIGGIDIISGSNMSGKTTFGKALFGNLAYSQGVGFARANAPRLPIYGKIINVDRPKHDPGEGLSSFGADIANWKNVIEKLEEAAPSFVFVDEPFSTTSSDYQEGLILSTLEWLASRGHRVVMATHNHEVINRLKRAESGSKVDIEFHNLHSEIDKTGDVKFTFKLVEGEAPSMAIAVARKIGGPALASIFY